MQTTTEIDRRFNTLLLTSSISLGLYVISISDWLLPYEFFIDLLLIVTLVGSMALLVSIIIESVNLRHFPKAVTTLAFVLVATTFVLLYGYRNGWFWGRSIIDGAFIDDRSRMDLELYQNGRFMIYSNWLFGEERYEGTYKLKGDTIIFDKYPVRENDFIAKEIIIDRPEKKIYFKKDTAGNYEKSFYYFQIDY